MTVEQIKAEIIMALDLLPPERLNIVQRYPHSDLAFDRCSSLIGENDPR
jgi:hypothetical protein